MMRSPHSFSIVCRRKSGSLFVQERPITDARKGVAAWPLVRGAMTLVESIRLGSEALRISANLFEKDLASESAENNTSAKPPSGGASVGLSLLAALSLPILHLASLPDEESPSAEASSEGARSSVSQGLMIMFALGLFIAAPQFGANVVNRLFHLGYDIRSTPFQLLTGGMKLMLVIGYLMLIRRVPEIRRVFQYHGAEHKTISTYEANEELTVENAQRKSTLHPRCGTTFLVMVAMVSVVIFSAISPLLPRLGTQNGLLENLGLFAIKLPFIPVIAAITYEIQRLTARYCVRGPLRALLWPGFLVQKITTIEPDSDQLEVALSSLRATLWRESNPAAAPATITHRTFPSYGELINDGGFASAG